ncbi:MAG: hypothetical protein K2X72_34245 [Reyranella sp.]|nr:hypothetical protein [Reyranella sp.]
MAPRTIDTVHHPPDIRACIFWLRNRRRQDWSNDPRPPSDGPADGEDRWNDLDAPDEARCEPAPLELRIPEDDRVDAQQDVRPVKASSPPGEDLSAERQAPSEMKCDPPDGVLSSGPRAARALIFMSERGRSRSGRHDVPPKWRPPDNYAGTGRARWL